MGILVDVILIAAIGGYAGYLIWHILSSMKAGKGNPYGCSGDCGKCGGGCSCSSQASGRHAGERGKGVRQRLTTCSGFLPMASPLRGQEVLSALPVSQSVRRHDIMTSVY